MSAAGDGMTALKGYEVWNGDKRCAYRDEDGCEKLLAHEDRVYRLLGQHPHVLECYGLVEVHSGVNSLRLERAPHGNIREFIRNNRKKPPCLDDRLRMALGVSSGIAHAHAKNVLHCDISCRNLFLFPDSCLKVGDFGNAAVDGVPSENNVLEEIRYELPLRGRAFDDRPSIKRELFALGSAIYEIIAWEMPFEDFGSDDVERLYAAEEFPDLSGLVAADIIRDCWAEKFETARDVEEAIKKLQQKRKTKTSKEPSKDISFHMMLLIFICEYS